MRNTSVIRNLTVILIAFVFSLPSLAQSNELAVTIGGYFPVNSRVDADNAFAVGGSYARRMASVPFISLYFELPVYATFDSTAHLSQAVQSPLGNPSYSALFITPGIKVKLAPSFPVSPYLVAGGGLARFSKSRTVTDDTTNTGTLDIGGGLDFKIAPFFSARGEVRDYYSGTPNILTSVTEREHNLLTTVGLVFRF
jgi:hypothetical protein